MPRILVMEGNTLARQADAKKLGVRSSSEIYIEAIRADHPEIGFGVVHAADHGQHITPAASFDAYDALVIGGSGLHAYDDRFEVQNQIDLLKSFAATGKPILGSCWGLQIAAIAGGGEVARSPKGREVGIARKIALNADGKAHAFFKGKPEVFDAPCIHYDEVTRLPAGATLLCSNAHSVVQAAIVPLGRSEVWALQYHPEFDLQHLSKLYDLYADDMVEQGFFRSRDEAGAYKADIDALAGLPDCSSLRWRLAIDNDILDGATRRREISNWIEDQVLRA